MNQSKNVVNGLLEHYHKQYSLAILYDHLASLINSAGYTFFSKYIRELANDKVHTHREIFLEHFDKAGILITGTPKLIAINHEENNTPLAIAKLIYSIENKIRSEINELAQLCLVEKDFEDFNFLQWYIADGLKDFGEIEQIVHVLTNGKSMVDNDLAIAKYLSLCESK